MPDATDEVPFLRVAILGTGLIGGSFGLAVRREFPLIEVVGFDRPDVLAAACMLEAVEETAKDISKAIRGADLVYIALPIGATIDALPAIAAAAKPNALVTDSGSTKAAICRAAERAFKKSARFLGGHPMSGKETSGIEQADADLFRNARYALISSAEDSDPRVRGFAALLRAIGAEPVWCDAETHDWAVSIVSHLPQLVAVALASVVQDETDETGMPVSLTGPGLQDMLRLAGSPYVLWRDIALTITVNIGRALTRLEQAIEHLRTNLTSKELEQEFKSANNLYKLLKKTT
ncbi:MAG: prephenate dehydrogenase/arogenate dehydrogenase family protein [Candidatus Acidiferrales bacterium]